MRITRNFFIYNGSLPRWLWCFSVVFLAGFLVGNIEEAYAARAGWRGKKSSQSSSSVRRLDRVAATTGKRVALVIGNSNYQDPRDSLSNPVNDASDISRELKGFGFEVETLTDLGHEAMNDAITNFGRRASNADVALFYYAGHGMQSKSQTYLIPVNAKLPSEARLAYEAVNLNLALDELENAQSKVNIVMLDACRNNSFGGSIRGKQRGLARLGDIPEGTVVVYATAPGKLSEDSGSNGRNGLFTEGVLKAFQQGDNLNLDRVLKSTSRYVETASNGVQSPYVNGPETLKEDFYFVGSAADNSGRDEAETARLADIERQNKQAREELQNTQAEIARAKRRQQEAEEQARLAEAAARRKQAAADAVVVPEERPQPPEQEAARCDYCPEMVQITSGTFMMGSPAGEGSDDERPQHEVTVGNFAIGKYEITVKQYLACVQAGGCKPPEWQEPGSSYNINTGSDDHYKKLGAALTGDNYPITGVSWDNANEYAAWLTGETGKTYRLPKEVEWEYACRGGAVSETYCGGNDVDSVAWYDGNSGSKTVIVHPLT